MLSGERASVADHHVGRGFHELPEFRDAFFGLQIEANAVVDAAVAEVSVERALVVELVEQAAEVAEIGAEFFGSDRGVFPALPVGQFAGDVRSRAQRGLAHFPDAPGLPGFGEQSHPWRIRAAKKRLY